MHRQLSLLVLALISACLAPGCSEEAQTKLDGNKGWTIPIVDAQAMTELREQAASENKVLVIDCWATWCGSCVAMFPKLHEAIKERGDGVMLISLSFDEGEDAAKKAAQFLFEQQARKNAYRAAEGSDATDAIAKALSDNWGGTILPAVFVYRPDGSTAYEFLETRGEVQDWVDAITSAVDEAMLDAEGSAGE